MMDFSSVTETNEAGLTPHAFAMNRHRYRFALDYCQNKDVLEVACGAGQGLGLLAKKARTVIGGDFTQNLVDRASAYYKDRLRVLRFDAQSMPFPDRSFDVVILFEALYYIPAPDRFLSETRRVLRPGGVVLISTINPEWPDFNPSPMSTRYYSARDLASLLRENGYEPEILGAFPEGPPTAKDSIVSLVRRVASSANLIPGSMKGKQLLKRLFYGKLISLPPELPEDETEFRSPEPFFPLKDTPRYRIIYAVGRPLGTKEPS